MHFTDSSGMNLASKIMMMAHRKCNCIIFTFSCSSFILSCFYISGMRSFSIIKMFKNNDYTSLGSAPFFNLLLWRSAKTNMHHT